MVAYQNAFLVILNLNDLFLLGIFISESFLINFLYFPLTSWLWI
jgi:hypothetical protein